MKIIPAKASPEVMKNLLAQIQVTAESSDGSQLALNSLVLDSALKTANATDASNVRKDMFLATSNAFSRVC